MKNRHGGAGRNQGRKPEIEKGTIVRLTVKPSVIEKFGGVKTLRSELYGFIKNKIQNN